MLLPPELFLNGRGEPMTRSGFEYVLEKHSAVASSKDPSIAKKRITPQSFDTHAR